MDSYRTFIEQKAKQKRDLLGKMFFPRTPVLLINLKNPQSVKSALTLKECGGLLSGLNSISLTTVVICEEEVREKLPTGKFLLYMDSKKLADAEAAADFVIDFHQKPRALRKKGCVPIAQQNGDETVDYNPIQEEGDGFYFSEPTQWSIFEAVVRARETYKFPYDWENLIRAL